MVVCAVLMRRPRSSRSTATSTTRSPKSRASNWRPRRRRARGTNFLIIGSDTRSFVRTRATAGVHRLDTTADGPARSDTMMVLHADGAHSYACRSRATSGSTSRAGQQKINAAFNEGPQKVIDTLKADFDVADQPLPRGELQDLRGHRERGRQRARVLPVSRRATSSRASPPPFGPGCSRSTGRLRSHRCAPATSSTSRTASGSNCQRRAADIDRISAPAGLHQARAHRGAPPSTDDPSSHPTSPTTVIPNLTVDHAFDRARSTSWCRRSWGSPTAPAGGRPSRRSRGGGRRAPASFLLVKQPEADAMLAVLRGQAPIPTSTTAPARRAASGRHHAGGATGRRAGAGAATRPGCRARRGAPSQALHTLGFVGRRHRATTPVGCVDHSEVRYRSSDEAKAQLVASRRARTRSWSRTPSLPGNRRRARRWARASTGVGGTGRPPRPRGADDHLSPGRRASTAARNVHVSAAGR